MRSPSNWFNPMLGQMPGVVSLAMLCNFLRRLPRPFVGGPVARGRQMIQDALAAVDAWSLRDRFEAMLVMQIPTLLLAAEEAEAAARAEPNFDRRMRMQRHMVALQRRAEALGADVRRHRRELATGQDLQHASPPSRSYDLDALEAVRQEPERELPETALVELPPAVVAPRYGIPMAVPGAEAAAEAEVLPVEGTGPDGKLEDRDEFEAEMPPRFQGVPKWKQARRQFLDELTEQETAELIEAQLVHWGDDRGAAAAAGRVGGAVARVGGGANPMCLSGAGPHGGSRHAAFAFIGANLRSFAFRLSLPVRAAKREDPLYLSAPASRARTSRDSLVFGRPFWT